MAKYSISYTEYSSSEGASRLSKQTATESFFIWRVWIWVILGIAWWYISAINELFIKKDYGHYLFSLLGVLITSVVGLGESVYCLIKKSLYIEYLVISLIMLLLSGVYYLLVFRKDRIKE